MKFNANDYYQKQDKRNANALKRACIDLSNYIKKQLSVACPPHSKPGEYPAKESGELRRSITWTVENEVGRVGTSKVYSKYLLAMDRDFLERAMKEREPITKDILGRK